MSVTPETNKTVSITEGPTPKAEFKKPAVHQKQCFMSPTDAMVSPCTQKLMGTRRFPRKLNVATGNQRPTYVYSHHPPSKLANKENERKATMAPKTVPPSSEAQTVTRPLETNV